MVTIHYSRQFSTKKNALLLLVSTFFMGMTDLKAQSLCTYTATDFACGNDSTGNPTATGYYTASQFGTIANAGLSAFNKLKAELVIVGQLSYDASDDGRAVYVGSSLGGVLFDSRDASISAFVGDGIVLRGATVDAKAGVVISHGYDAFGVSSSSTYGNNLTIGSNTIVTGVDSVGLSTRAYMGNNLTVSGSVTALGNLAKGVDALTLPRNGVCGVNTVIVNGDIHGDIVGVRTTGCGDNLIHVGAAQTVRTANPLGYTLYGITDARSRVIVDGVVDAGTTGWAIAYWRGRSETVINDGGVVNGLLYKMESDLGGADSVTINPGGRWIFSGESEFGTGDDWITNQGTIVATGLTRLANLETFTNSGIVSLINGASKDSLTIAGDYIGTGNATLLIDASGQAADRLIIDGTASGATLVFVTGASRLISKPILVVDSLASSANAFILGDASPSALIDLTLSQRGADYFLTAAPSTVARQPLTAAVLSRDMWRRSSELYASSGMRSLRREAGPKNHIRFWAAGTHQSAAAFGHALGFHNRAQIGVGKAQAGVDLRIGSNFVLGGTAGYQRSAIGPRSDAEAIEARGSNLGFYGLFGSPTGLYVAALIKRDRNRVRLANRAFSSADGNPDTTSTGMQLETGYRVNSGSLMIDINGALAYVSTEIRGFTVEDIKFDFDRATSLDGRIGMTIEFGGTRMPFVDAKLFHELASKNEMTLLSGSDSETIDATGDRFGARLETGIGRATKRGGRLAAYVEAGTTRSLGLTAELKW